MTPERLKQLRELCDGASPGEWAVEFGKNEQANIYAGPDEWVALCPHQCVASIEVQAKHNARFIAAARTAVPELLDEVERLRQLAELNEDPLKLCACNACMAAGVFTNMHAAGECSTCKQRERAEAAEQLCLAIGEHLEFERDAVGTAKLPGKLPVDWREQIEAMRERLRNA